ncbi:MAG: hypothetical protein IT305_06865 [Chloroflexi bacterium]|nr:hypothetical protein [Chloroflexota bacterium]
MKAQAGQAPAARAAARAAGARVNTSRYTRDIDESISVWVPIRRLTMLAEHQTVLLISAPPGALGPSAPQPSEDRSTTSDQISTASLIDTLGDLGVTAWHAGQVRGQGIKVGIIDSGYRGYRNFAETFDAELECNDDAKYGSIDSLQDLTDYGTRVAWVLKQIAQDAKLYIAKSGDSDILR